MRRIVGFSLVGLVCVLSGSMLAGELRLPALFSDHMVLQRDMTVPVWGWAAPGDAVTVSIGSRTASAKVGADGKWMVKLDELKVGEGGTLTVKTDKGESVEVKDVLVGEVWLASGQSNMQMSLGGALNAKKELAAARHPNLRLFQVPQTVSGEPRDDVDVAWSVCSPATARRFSAVGYFFGRDLLEDLKVPVGIIHASLGGSPAEVWMSRSALEAVKDHTDQFKKWEEGLALWHRVTDVKVYPDPTANVYAYDQAALAAMRETGPKIKELRREGKPIPDDLQKRWNSHRMMRALLKDRVPCGLFNGMINPLVPFAIRGVIWYQGEANTRNPDAYGTLIRALIVDWRKLWKQGDFPFLMVALANFKKPPVQPGDSDWARVRDAQFKTARTMTNVGCASAVDIGDADNIHPKNKQEVGRRLALQARSRVYGQSVECEGPIFKEWKNTPDGVLVKFDHADGLHAKDDETARGFAVAGSDREWRWAEGAVNADGSVLLNVDAGLDPVAIRYGWADNPTGNLHNASGLPAAPFRTDDWERVVTKGGRK